MTGPLDPLSGFRARDEVNLARNPNTPFEELGQTSLFRFPVGKRVLHEMILRDPKGIADDYRFEQRFVTRTAPGGVSFRPRGWMRHFRLHCVRIFPLSYLVPPRLPAGTRIVICFPGPLTRQTPSPAAGVRTRPSVLCPPTSLQVTDATSPSPQESTHLRYYRPITG